MSVRVRKFFSYYRPYRRLFLILMGSAFIVSTVSLALPLCAGFITRNVLGEITPDTLNQIVAMGALMLGLVALHTLCNLFVDYRGHVMGAMMESDMRAELFDHYQQLSFRFYDEQKTGQLMSRISNDLFWISELCHHGPEDLVLSLLKFVGSFVILLTINVELTLITFLFLPVMAVYALVFQKRVGIALGASKARIGDVNAQIEETLAGIRVVKSFTNEAIERDKFADANRRFVASRADGYRAEAYHWQGVHVFTHLITIAVIVFGGAAIVQQTLDLPELLTFLLYVGIMVEPIHKLENFARLYQEGITGFNRFMEIMEIAPDITDAPDAVELGWVQGAIQFREVSFRYHDDHDYVLENLSLDIRAGEYVALVGSSGVGKSTLCSLIPRFYEVTQGHILLDGHDIRQVTLRSLRRTVGVVQQDVYLFSGTVADNIRYGKPDATPAEIVEAARKANAHDFIMALPNGYDTDIGQRGVKLSGGQKQRLSIARVFLKNPPIILFDEATSSLDNESEKAIQESLEKLAEERTVIVIAHRLTTIRKAHRILVLTDAGIDEQGTHEELIARGGVYTNLYQLQSRP